MDRHSAEAAESAWVQEDYDDETLISLHDLDGYFWSSKKSAYFDPLVT